LENPVIETPSAGFSALGIVRQRNPLEHPTEL
jgi:hypothetical protein